MGTERDLAWEGCTNVRDLGGLPTTAGGTTRRGAVIRADSLHLLTDEGWRAALAHGVRSVVDLRHPGERAAAEPVAARPDDVAVVEVPVEDEDDAEFLAEWGDRLGTPHYYRAALDRYADRTAAAVRAVATAPPGGVVVHCVAGRDRTGLVTALVLALCGVPTDVIAADHAASYDALAPRLDAIDPHAAAVGAAELAAGWRDEHAAAIGTLLGGVDVAEVLRAGGVTDTEMASLVGRLTDRGGGPAGGGGLVGGGMTHDDSWVTGRDR